MFGVKIRRFEVRESIHVVLKLIQIIEIQDGCHACQKKEHFWICINLKPT